MICASAKTPHLQIKYLVRRSFDKKNIFRSYFHNKSPSYVSADDNNVQSKWGKGDKGEKIHIIIHNGSFVPIDYT